MLELLDCGILEVKEKKRKVIFHYDYEFLACQILTAKAILGIGLIYYYYRILFIFLPISPKLGPMMIRLRCMVNTLISIIRLFAHHWNRLWMIFLHFCNYLLSL